MRAAVLIAKQQIETVDHDIGTIGPNDVRIQIRAGGICGSDLHYYNHYRMGDFPVREPFILGHEGAGIVECIGSNVTEISVGDVVTVNPSQPCRSCEFCLSGRELLCSNMKFLGSSRRTPHVQGIFSEFFSGIRNERSWNAGPETGLKATGNLSFQLQFCVPLPTPACNLE